MVSFDNWPSSCAELSVPAHPDLVASVRAMTRAMAVLADLALEHVEELQMAVDEAAILLLPLVDGDGDQLLRTQFEVEDGCVRIVLSVAGRDGAVVDKTGLPWMMLTALDPTAEIRAADGAIGIAISRRTEGLRR